jgi:hypothetical protein
LIKTKSKKKEPEQKDKILFRLNPTHVETLIKYLEETTNRTREGEFFLIATKRDKNLILRVEENLINTEPYETQLNFDL